DLSVLGSPPSRAVDAARWWVLRSRLEEAWGRDRDALNSLEKAVAADARNQEAHHRLGRALIRRGDSERGRSHLDRAEALRTREETLRRQLERLLSEGFDAQTLERLGRLCRESGMPAEAGAWFELAARSDPRR